MAKSQNLKECLKNLKFIEQEILMWEEYQKKLENPLHDRIEVNGQDMSLDEAKSIIENLEKELKIQRNTILKFIPEIPYSHIRMGIIYKYQQGLTWKEAAQKMGFASGDSLRLAVHRYLQSMG